MPSRPGVLYTRWEDFSLKREGAAIPPRWRLMGSPNLEAVWERSPDLKLWQPAATNRLPVEGWLVQAGPEPFGFYRARVRW